MKTKKIIATVMIITCISIFPQRAHAAVAWGTLNIVGDMTKQMMEEISIQIRDAIFASAKMVAIKQATSTIETLLYGGSSSPRNIKNFEEFLITDPQETAITYAEDFLTTSLRGTTSGDYTSSGGSAESALKEAITSAGEAVIESAEGTDEMVVDLAECTGDSFFSEGDYKCFSSIFSNPLNTPIGMALATDQVMQAKYQEEMAIAQLKATSSGTLPQENEEGDVVNPSSVVEEIQLQQITLPLEALANGDSNAFSSLIQSFAVQLITGVVERGLGEVEQSIDENMDAFRDQYEEEMGDYYDAVGPAMEYAGDAYDYVQQEENKDNQWVNPDTGEVYVDSNTTNGNGEYGR